MSALERFPAPEILLGMAWFDPAAKSVQVRRWLNDDAYSRPHGHRHADVNRHDDRIGAFCIAFEGDVSWPAVVEWLDLLLAARGEQVLRLKGILKVAGRANPVVVQGVQHMIYPPAELAGWPDDDRRSRIVFITRDLTRSAVETSLVQVLGVSAGSP